jgi:outer membrane murein-binding lipoprotein Lpp
MRVAQNTSHRNGLVRYATLAVVNWLWIAGCATNTAELKQEIEVLLKQTMDEVRQEKNRMDSEIARLKSEVGQLRSTVGRVDSTVGHLDSEIGQLGSELALMQIDMRKNDTSLVDLAVRVNQLDRRATKRERQAPQNGERALKPAGGRGSAGDQQTAAVPVASPPEEPAKALKYGMSQQKVLRMFGNPHAQERILDSVYWYYADGELKGQYVRFDAMTGYVNGWSTFSPQSFQLDLRTAPGGPVR